MKAQQQHDWLFFSSVIQTHLDCDDGQTTRCSQLLDHFLSFLSWTKWTLEILHQSFFSQDTWRWNLTSGRCGWARGKREPKRRVILINKTVADFIIISPLFQRDGAEKSWTWVGWRGAVERRQQRWHGLCLPLAAENSITSENPAICSFWLQQHFDGLLTSRHLFYIWTMWRW